MIRRPISLFFGAHLCEQFLQVQQLGLSHWDPYAMRRGCCLELYYCNMVEWSWWDSGFIWKTNWFPSVLWHWWFGHMPLKFVPEMTYNVLSGTLNLYTTNTRPFVKFTLVLLPCQEHIPASETFWPSLTAHFVELRTWKQRLTSIDLSTVGAW